MIGLAAYLALVAVSLAVLFLGLRERLKPAWPGTPAIAQAGIAAAYAALLLHTLVYAAYLEDPLTWALLAIVAGLRVRHEGTVPPDEAPEGAPTKGGLSPLGVTRA